MIRFRVFLLRLEPGFERTIVDLGNPPSFSIVPPKCFSILPDCSSKQVDRSFQGTICKATVFGRWSVKPAKSCPGFRLCRFKTFATGRSI